MTSAAKVEVALRASLVAFAILAAFALGGSPVLEALGITVPAFRVAGGLLLFFVAFDMLFASASARCTGAAQRPPATSRSAPVT